MQSTLQRTKQVVLDLRLTFTGILLTLAGYWFIQDVPFVAGILLTAIGTGHVARVLFRLHSIPPRPRRSGPRFSDADLIDRLDQAVQLTLNSYRPVKNGNKLLFFKGEEVIEVGRSGVHESSDYQVVVKARRPQQHEPEPPPWLDSFEPQPALKG